MYYYSFCLNFVRSFIPMWVGKDALATLAHLSPPPTLPDATQEVHANFATSHRTTHSSYVARVVRCGGSVLRAPPALRAERLSALLRVQATSLRSVTCTLRRADTLLVRLRRLASRSYHRPLTERHAGGARAPCSSGRAVVGTTPGASNLAALGDLHPTQSRHIACAASPLSVGKLPPTAFGTPRRRRTPTTPLSHRTTRPPASGAMFDAAAPFSVRPLLFGQSGCRHYSGCKPPRCAR